MTALAGRIGGWFFPSARPERLAVLRVLVGSFALLYVGVRARVYLSLADADPSRFEPVGVLSLLPAPVPDRVLVGCYAVAVAGGIGFVTGSWFRVSGPAFALSLLALSTYRSSWGQILWLENVMVLQVLIVGFARSADALSWRRARRGLGTQGDHCAAHANASETYGVPVRLAALVTVATYVLSAVAKIRLAGMAWITSDSLRNHVAGSIVRAELLDAPSSPVGRWLVGYAWLFPPLAAASLALELASPIALAGGRLRDVWVALAWLMHLSVAVLMYVVFPYPLFLIAFAPFYNLEHLAVFWRRLRLHTSAAA